MTNSLMFMVPQGEKESTAIQEIAAFYDRLAPDYDTMTGFEKRFVHEKPFFRLIVDRYNVKTAIDAGCGTGFHTLLLTQLGVKVTAVDISREMLDRLRTHAKDMQMDIRLVESGFEDLRGALSGTFDAVFAMGNTLPHLLTRSELQSALGSFALMLSPGGILFFQNLNYDRILASGESVQSVKELNGITFIRYYEYAGDRIRFHLFKLQSDGTTSRHDLSTVELRPILQAELLELLPAAGFKQFKMFGSIAMEEFRPESSKDLVVLATQTA
jgi:2-polyprenyl-3-methyl-5-hydroxy-6-metoxy-1,4-benzoquinol methylase